MSQTKIEYLAAGGNRHPSSADWAPGLLTFGANNNIATWNPDDPGQQGISSLLSGHTDTVNAIRIHEHGDKRRIISGGADKTIRIWHDAHAPSPTRFQQTACLTDHTGSINTIATLPDGGYFASGSADGTVVVWKLDGPGASAVQTIILKPKFLPLTLAMTSLCSGDMILAVAGTFNNIQMYVRERSKATFELQATLSGHEGWIRSLDFTQERSGEGSDILLASASQDKYVRIWRISSLATQTSSREGADVDAASDIVKSSLSNKTHEIGSPQARNSVTFEALIVGHEDWIFTAKWKPRSADSAAPPVLLSASADNSLSMWIADEASGLWICDTRLGEISSQKGSTTATGSTGGFWIGLWQPDGRSVASLGRTGSWRRWTLDESNNIWVQQIGVSGHVGEVQGLAWSPDGSYLISTSSDQTTRLLCKWRTSDHSSWHEFSRPQIHGYDLNCIGTITSNQFVSGADEKLLRVFNKPKAIDRLLSRLCGTAASTDGDLPDAANIPVLGLSNKAVKAVDDGANDTHTTFNGHEDDNPSSWTHRNTLDLDSPPLEDHLARHTLWPEHEKLYGHGYEISAVATSHDGTLIATACKASTIDYATIRIFETRDWREVKPPLTAHSLTVTSMAFSPDDDYLLSVGRDRQWAVFTRHKEAPHTYSLHSSDPKGHSRMILGCSWGPAEAGYVFGTAGRDKIVKIWRLQGDQVTCCITIPAESAVTAIAFDLQLSCGNVRLAYACEGGSITVAHLDGRTLALRDKHEVERSITPSRTINALTWRPHDEVFSDSVSQGTAQLGVASDDCSVRIYNVQ